MLVRESTLYGQAIAALTALKEQHGKSAELKAIAKFLFYAEDAEFPERLFPYVGTGSELDQAVIQAYRDEWERLNSEDDD